MEKKKRMTGEEKLMKEVAILSGADGWELISASDYQRHTPEEIEQMKKSLKADVEKAIENL